MASLDDPILRRIRQVVLRYLRGNEVTVYLFGSHATGGVHRLSDVDVAVMARRPLPPGLLPRLREALEESTIPTRVDIVDLKDADQEFRDRVLREGILWNE